MQRRRPIFKAALVALILAGAGTYGAMRYTHTPTPPLPAVLQAVPAHAAAVVREIRGVPAVLHAPTRSVQRGAERPSVPRPAAPHREWERQPLGRGEIIQHH